MFIYCWIFCFLFLFIVILGVLLREEVLTAQQVRVAQLLSSVRGAVAAGDATRALDLAIQAVRAQHPESGEAAVFGYINRAKEQYFAENPDSPFAPPPAQQSQAQAQAQLQSQQQHAVSKAALPTAAERAEAVAAELASDGASANEQLAALLAMQGQLHAQSQLGGTVRRRTPPAEAQQAAQQAAQSSSSSEAAQQVGWLSSVFGMLSLSSWRGSNSDDKSKNNNETDAGPAAAGELDLSGYKEGVVVDARRDEDSVPILEQQGLGAVLDSLAQSEDSVVCVWCNGLIARRRMEAHAKYWCEASPHVQDLEEDDDD